MKYQLSYETLKSYYRNFKPSSPVIIQFLMIFTLGLYLINWVYTKNREFEDYSDEAPDSKRGAVLMLIFPFSWMLIIWIMNELILPNSEDFMEVLNVAGWCFIMFMILQYLYEFCYLYGQITRTEGLIWYYTIFPGFLALILLPLGFWYTIPLLFFPVVSIPAMQAKLNYESERMVLQRESVEYYRHGRKF